MKNTKAGPSFVAGGDDKASPREVVPAKDDPNDSIAGSLNVLWVNVRELGPLQIMGGTWLFVHALILTISDIKSTPVLVAASSVVAMYLLTQSSKWKNRILWRGVAVVGFCIACYFAYWREESISKFKIYPYAAFVGQSPTSESPKSITLVIFILGIYNAAENASVAGYGCEAKSGEAIYLGTHVWAASNKIGQFIPFGEQRVFVRDKEVSEQIKGRIVPSRETVTGWMACRFETDYRNLVKDNTQFTLVIHDDRRKAYKETVAWELPIQKRALRRTFSDLNLLPDPYATYSPREWSNVYIHLNGLLHPTRAN